MRITVILLLLALSAAAQAPPPATGNAGIGNQPQQQAPSPQTPRAENRLQDQVAHALNMLPTYSLFDIISYQVQGSTVILDGRVRTVGLKAAAEDAVKKVEGVEKVQNNIQELPPSEADDHVRAQIARAIFDTPALQPYSMGVVPPIHIIVDNSNVWLEGIVNSQADKDLAGLKASTVPGVFSVTNDLRVQK